jgi:hypothetical protein
MYRAALEPPGSEVSTCYLESTWPSSRHIGQVASKRACWVHFREMGRYTAMKSSRKHWPTYGYRYGRLPCITSKVRPRPALGLRFWVVGARERMVGVACARAGAGLYSPPRAGEVLHHRRGAALTVILYRLTKTSSKASTSA